LLLFQLRRNTLFLKIVFIIIASAVILQCVLACKLVELFSGMSNSEEMKKEKKQKKNEKKYFVFWRADA
jgi:predicted membrane protein